MTDTTPPTPTQQPRKQRLPILARHAVSLAVVFAIALPISFFVGQRVYRHLQLDKLAQADRAAFDEGLAYVYGRAAEDGVVQREAVRYSASLDPERATELLLTVATAHAEAGRPVPQGVTEATGSLMARMTVDQAVGLYDAYTQIPGSDRALAGKLLHANIQTPTDSARLRAVELLDSRLLWSKDQVPGPKWIAWLSLLLESKAEVTQHKSARLLGELPDELDKPAVADALDRLSRSRHDSVRAQVLKVAAGYAAIAKDPADYEQIIYTLGEDKNKIIARRAWMIVGHLKPFSGYAVNWKDADPFVAEAMLWSAVKNNPEDPRPAIDAVLSGDLVAEGLLALDEAQDMTLLKLQEELGAGDLIHQSGAEQPNFRAAWRAVLALDPDTGDMEYWSVNLFQFGKFQPLEYWTPEQQTEYGLQFRNRFFAMTYRFNEFYPPQGIALTTGDPELGELAAFEGLALSPRDQQDAINPPRTVLARLVAGAYALLPSDSSALVESAQLDQPAIRGLLVLSLLQSDERLIGDLLRAADPDKRTLGALAAALSGDKPSLVDGVTADFLRKHPELAGDQLRDLSDAELADLGLKRVDAFTALLDAAEAAPASAKRQNEAKLLKLALWVRGDLGDGFTPKAEAMLFDKDLPTTTVLMCLLHKQRPVALEYLLGDRVSPPPDLRELFIGQRYWHVFRHFVDTSELTLWLWGDPEAQAFQIEAMRQWYAVNRWKIKRGWWPEPVVPE